MKLIIDIDNEDYNAILGNISGLFSVYDLIGSIKCGTPFDSVIEDIKQEIEETYRDSLKEDINYAEGLERAWIIIDKHMRGKTNET